MRFYDYSEVCAAVHEARVQGGKVHMEMDRLGRVVRLEIRK
jgi:hypothetical protein